MVEGTAPLYSNLNNQPSAPPMWSPVPSTVVQPQLHQSAAPTPDAVRYLERDTTAIRNSQEELRKSWQVLEEQQRYVQVLSNTF